MVTELSDCYYRIGRKDDALAVASEMADALLESTAFHMQFYPYAKEDTETLVHYIYRIVDFYGKWGEKEKGDALEKSLGDILSTR